MSAKKISKSTRRKIEKAAKKAAKKHPVATLIVVLLVVAIVGCCVLHRKRVIHLPFLDGIIPQESVVEDVDGKGGAFTQEDIAVIKDSDLSIHFLELGNEFTGDCTLIKVGNTEVLIDAGSRQNSASTIKDYIDDYCTDGILEYVIATHAHQDHIAGFVGSDDVDGIFESFVCETIIDFPKTDSTSQIYNDYKTLRDAEVATNQRLGYENARHFTALECYNGENGAEKSYMLAEGITLNILYQKYYEEEASKENNYSVCVLLSQGENHYLFTGDLEKLGEESLVEKNPTLPKCKLFKAGHHGSNTSSNTVLLEKIKPDIVCVCCCCGNMEYAEKPENDFPAQAFVDRVAEYTPNVFVTTIVADNGAGFTSMNGNIVLLSNDGNLTMLCSNNMTKLKDTDWFKANRTTPDKWKAA